MRSHFSRRIRAVSHSKRSGHNRRCVGDLQHMRFVEENEKFVDATQTAADTNDMTGTPTFFTHGKKLSDKTADKTSLS